MLNGPGQRITDFICAERNCDQRVRCGPCTTDSSSVSLGRLRRNHDGCGEGSRRERKGRLLDGVSVCTRVLRGEAHANMPDTRACVHELHCWHFRSSF